MSNSDRSAPADQARLFVMAAPSGTGKSTLIQRVFAADWENGGPPEFSVSHTTRAARPGEVHGEHYFFVDQAEFERMVETEEFLEFAEVHGQMKGTSRAEVDRRLAAGVDVLLDIDVQGVASVLAAHPDACSILIMPPSYLELENRISGRGHDSADDIARRLAVSLWEIERYRLFDYVIINDDIERACREFVTVIQSQRLRRDRNESRIRVILDDFHRALTPTERPLPETRDGSNPRED